VKSVWYFSGQEPKREADCKPNEVEVPRVVGSTLAEARARLASQPLRHDLIYKPAKPGQRLDVVLGQMPGRGTLSAYDVVTLILARPRFGVVPSVVGMPVPRAVERLEQLKLHPAVVGGAVKGRVIRQQPRGGRVAAAPGMAIRLVVSAG
jgi:beta-lactam-binding protein with PASTA domain